LRKTHTTFGRFHSLFDERDGRRIFVLERAHGETLAGTQMRPATDRATSAAYYFNMKKVEHPII
jgi:hypothetical protein